MNEFSEIQSQYKVGIYIQDCVNGGAESSERPYFLLEPEFAMNIVETSCDLGGEEGEEKKNKAVDDQSPKVHHGSAPCSHSNSQESFQTRQMLCRSVFSVCENQYKVLVWSIDEYGRRETQHRWVQI